MNDKYPWELWGNGEVHEVEEGVDYQCTRASFVSYLKQLALSWGVTVHIQNMKGYNVKFCFGNNFVRDIPKAGGRHGDGTNGTFRWYKGEKVYDD